MYMYMSNFCCIVKKYMGERHIFGRSPKIITNHLSYIQKKREREKDRLVTYKLCVLYVYIYL